MFRSLLFCLSPCPLSGVKWQPFTPVNTDFFCLHILLACLKLDALFFSSVTLTSSILSPLFFFLHALSISLSDLFAFWLLFWSHEKLSFYLFQLTNLRSCLWMKINGFIDLFLFNFVCSPFQYSILSVIFINLLALLLTSMPSMSFTTSPSVLHVLFVSLPHILFQLMFVFCLLLFGNLKSVVPEIIMTLIACFLLSSVLFDQMASVYFLWVSTCKSSSRIVLVG